ncbi:MAG: hypothetical protein LBD04_11450 [Synergistaceae bacterium]|nr:hypothetical protein [Synergistaceae bacterium]
MTNSGQRQQQYQQGRAPNDAVRVIRKALQVLEVPRHIETQNPILPDA